MSSTIKPAAPQYETFTPETSDDFLRVWEYRVIVKVSQEPGISPRIILRKLVPRVLNKFEGTRQFIETNMEVLPIDLDFQNTVMDKPGMNPIEASVLRRAYLLWIQIGQPCDWRLTIYKDYEGVRQHGEI
jgi:hypothetical protein